LSMAKKALSTEEAQVQALLTKMQKQGLPTGASSFDISSVPSGISSFDHSTGVGGFPRRRFSVLQGEEGTGKTLLLLATIAQTQRTGGRAAFVDCEHALTPDFARLLGVDFESLILSRPQNMNEAYDVAREFWTSGLFDLVGMDSLVALATVEEIQSSASDTNKRAGLAQLHSQELRKMVSTISDRTAFIGINQLRENPNPPKWWKGGKQLYSPGGKAIRFYSSMTVDVRVGGFHTKNTVRIGQIQKTYIVKNKVAAPYTRAEYDLMYKGGLDLFSDLITTALRLGLIEKHSSWFSFDMLEDGSIVRTIKENGREAFEAAFRGDTEAYDNLQAQVMSLADEQEWEDYNPTEVEDGED